MSRFSNTFSASTPAACSTPSCVCHGVGPCLSARVRGNARGSGLSVRTGLGVTGSSHSRPRGLGLVPAADDAAAARGWQSGLVGSEPRHEGDMGVVGSLMSSFDEMGEFIEKLPATAASTSDVGACPVGRTAESEAQCGHHQLDMFDLGFASVATPASSRPTTELVVHSAAPPNATQRQERQAHLVSKSGSNNPLVRKAAETGLLVLNQRGSQGYYASEWAFPNQKDVRHKDILAKDALKVVPDFVCKGILRCPGGCLENVDVLDVCKLRSELLFTCSTVEDRFSYLCSRLAAAYDRSADRFDKLKIALGAYSNANVCATSFALAFGYNESQLRRAIEHVKQDQALVTTYVKPDANSSVVALVHAESPAEADSLLRGYVLEVLLRTGDMNPAPLGSARSQETVVRKQSWALHWKQCQQHFKRLGRVAPGSKNKLKRIMKAERRLVQKTVNSHPKCQTCVLLASRWRDACKLKGPEGEKARQMVREEILQHERNHMGERAVLDSHSYLAIAQPHRFWVIIADAATQRNFRLPKLHGRPAKDLVKATFFNFKLMATYAPGFGFTPYLLHNSASAGDNLVWTVIWDTITRMREYYGYTPDELFILLDNTTGDNKNMTMIGVCAWLVATGKFRRVRVFFLMVGHTHVIIDQIFGVITTGLRSKELLLPADMQNSIDSILASNPQYQAHPCSWLRTVFDWKTFVRTKCQLFPKLKNLFHKNNFAVTHDGHVDNKFNGMHDFHFISTEPCRKLNCHLLYRRSSKEPLLPSDRAGILCFMDAPPLNTKPDLCIIKPISQWGNYQGRDSSPPEICGTISKCIRDARGLTSVAEMSRVQAKWTEILSSIAKHATHGLPIEHQLRFDDFLANRVAPELADGALASLLAFDFDHMSNPPVDPVVSATRSVAEINREIHKLRGLHRLCSGPCIDTNSPAYEGDFVLLRGAPVSLVRVSNRSRGDTLLVKETTYTATCYDHTPAPETTGLWGTFIQAKGSAPKKISHCDILVFNAATRPASEPKTVRLHRTTLIELARAVPDQTAYAMPASLPESHRDAESDEEELDDAERLAKGGRRRAKSVRRPGRTRKPVKRQKATHDDDEDANGDDDEDEDEDDDDDSDDDDSDDEDSDDEKEEDYDVRCPTHLLQSYRAVAEPTFDDTDDLVAQEQDVAFTHLCVWGALPPAPSKKKSSGKRADPTPDSHQSSSVWVFGEVVKDYVRATGALHKHGWSHDYSFMLIHDAKTDQFVSPAKFGRPDLGGKLSQGIKLDRTSWHAESWAPMRKA